MDRDLFVRAHTFRRTKARRDEWTQVQWPQCVLVFDTETTIDTNQKLTFAVYRICELEQGRYLCREEGLVYADRLAANLLKKLYSYAENHFANVALKTFPPNHELKVLSRSVFMEKIFWRTIQTRGMIVGFNLPFDLSRIAVQWKPARNGGWSLIFSLRRSRKTRKLEPNPDRPRIRCKSTSSKSAFLTLAKPRVPEEWPTGRLLDLRTLAFALYGESYSLDSLCQLCGIPGKTPHEPSGKISKSEIDYCRNDVRATADALNYLKAEFDLHGFSQLQPDRAYSSASIAKAYLDEMGVVPPQRKFKTPNRIHGIAMQSYYGGRAECRIRHTQVPVVHTDFTSQYPTVNTLLQNWNVLTASRLSFRNATGRIRKLLRAVIPNTPYRPKFWQQLRFFALVRPDDDVLPVRTSYNGMTQNIGINRLTSKTPVWFAGPDLIASILLSGKVPHIEKAIELVPHGKQRGLCPAVLRDMIEVDPAQHDFFKFVIEQRAKHKSNKPLSRFLKVLANAGSYGLFVELTPENLKNRVNLKVFSGESSFSQASSAIEKSGKWYFPPLASLITAGGRLLLAMLEKNVSILGGTYLFCDTDSLCIVASKEGGLVPCAGGNYRLANGAEAIKALSWQNVRRIAKQFAVLNPYEDKKLQLLKIEDVNYDKLGNPIRLHGFGISAKRYVLFVRNRGLKIVDAKAHGLGYLYPPQKSEFDWIFEAWDWLLRGTLNLPRKAPIWLNLPAMMRVSLTTPNVLKHINTSIPPYSFLLCPMIDTVTGFPKGVNPQQFTLVAPFSKNRARWIDSECFNIFDGKPYRLSLSQNACFDRVVPQTYGYVLRLYLFHPESKSLSPDGSLCSGTTAGLLQRASINVRQFRYIGKESDRRWTHGEDLSLTDFQSTEYSPRGEMTVADLVLLKVMSHYGMREMIRKSGLSQHTIEIIRDRKPVRRRTLLILKKALES